MDHSGYRGTADIDNSTNMHGCARSVRRRGGDGLMVFRLSFDDGKTLCHRPSPPRPARTGAPAMDDCHEIEPLSRCTLADSPYSVDHASTLGNSAEAVAWPRAAKCQSLRIESSGHGENCFPNAISLKQTKAATPPYAR